MEAKNECLNCGGDAKNKFCSKSCSSTYNNKLRSMTKLCLNCDGIITGSGKKYCSAKCQNSYQRKIIFDKIELGEHKSLDSRIYKDYLIGLYGEKCMKCEWACVNENSNTIPLELHHIDCNPDNNKSDNLELLCPNCHSLTKNWKGITSGDGRFSRRREQRRENYNNGKAW
jgi:hypothetical protein